MLKKIFSMICLLIFVGCEYDNEDESDYPFSNSITVSSINDPLGKKEGDIVQLDSQEGTFSVYIVDGVHLQREKADHSGYYDIPQEQYIIITPGTVIQFAYTDSQIDFTPDPDVVRPETIRILK